jgi:hypothetical protein
MASSRPVLYPSHVEVVMRRLVCCCLLRHRSALHVILVSVYTQKKIDSTVQLGMIITFNGWSVRNLRVIHARSSIQIIFGVQI